MEKYFPLTLLCLFVLGMFLEIVVSYVQAKKEVDRLKKIKHNTHIANKTES